MNHKMKQIAGILLTCLIWACIQTTTNSKIMENQPMNKLDTAYFGAGCFWCIHAIFQDFKGVIQVESGYANGETENPSYKEVCTGMTGHAEVVEVVFDPEKISYSTLCEIFWHAHDPTTLNRQGADIGTQYRSGVYFTNETQQQIALEVLQKIKTEKVWDDPIVTEIVPLKKYFSAENYHQDYFRLNPEQGYCSAVIAPKVSKIRKLYASLLKN